MVKGWTIVSVRRSNGYALRSGYKNYVVKTKHINGHEETYVLEALDELDAWQAISDWIGENYEA